MRISPLSRSSKSVFYFIGLLFLAAICGSLSTARAANAKPPVLLSTASSTRAIALESVTLKAEPFPLTSTVKFSTDTRTRICIFAMGLELLPGEGANAFSADAQDAAGKLYPLKWNMLRTVPGFPGITMFIVRLADDMGDVGDVLLRLNLHGMGSNRVRVGIGHVGGGPADDPVLYRRRRRRLRLRLIRRWCPIHSPAQSPMRTQYVSSSKPPGVRRRRILRTLRQSDSWLILNEQFSCAGHQPGERIQLSRSGFPAR